MAAAKLGEKVDNERYADWKTRDLDKELERRRISGYETLEHFSYWMDPRRPVAAMSEVASGILARDRFERMVGGLKQNFEGSRLRLPQDDLHLRESLLDGVEVRRIARQEP